MSFCIGFSSVMPMTEVVDSCCTSIFVCFAKNSHLLRNSRPELYEDIMDALAYAVRSHSIALFLTKFTACYTAILPRKHSSDHVTPRIDQLLYCHCHSSVLF